MYYEPEGVFEMEIEEILNEYGDDLPKEGSKSLLPADADDEDATEAEILAACAESVATVIADAGVCELPPVKKTYLDVVPLPQDNSRRAENDYDPRGLWLVLYQWIDGAPMQIDAAPVTGPWKTIENGQAKQFAVDELAIEWDIDENSEVLVEVVVAPDKEAAMMADGEAEEMWVSV